jgi:hypothetical protein
MLDLPFDLDIDRGLAGQGLGPKPERCRLQQVKKQEDQEEDQ